MFFDKRDLSFMSHTAIISKFKCAGFQMKDAIELEADINLVPVLPDEDTTLSGSVALGLIIS